MNQLDKDYLKKIKKQAKQRSDVEVKVDVKLNPIDEGLMIMGDFLRTIDRAQYIFCYVEDLLLALKAKEVLKENATPRFGLVRFTLTQLYQGDLKGDIKEFIEKEFKMKVVHIFDTITTEFRILVWCSKFKKLDMQTEFRKIPEYDIIIRTYERKKVYTGKVPKDRKDEMVRVKRRTYVKTRRTLADWYIASAIPRGHIEKSEGMSMKEDE